MPKPKLPVRSALRKRRVQQGIARAAEPTSPSRGRPALERELRRDLMNTLVWYANDHEDESLDGLAGACAACLPGDFAEAFATSWRAICRFDEQLMTIMASYRRNRDSVTAASALLARELNLLDDAADSASLATIAERFRKAK